MVVSIYCFDIDDTICTTEGVDYSSSKPIVDRITKINSLYDNGAIIKIYTARGSKTGIDWRDHTEKQLRSWGVKYHELHMGKPFADLYIDDKAIKDSDFDW
jgi:hypothetical protein